jgi:hypothetical protein
MSERTLKEQALLERIAELTVTYEDKDADRRIQITELVNQLEEVQKSYNELIMAIENSANNQVVEGEVVEESTPDESS